ncbi:MAG: OsmC family protein [Planctomycetota bacterium]|jgi:ribosomal protein S12 methylthiotransferase accessory factor
MTGLEIGISFPGNKRVDADFGKFTIPTDQTVKNGGDESAPEPYNLFLASMGTCAGYYVLAFCDKRNIPLKGVSMVQKHEFIDPGHILSKVSFEIRVPPGFPEKYRRALVNAAASCGVKKAIDKGIKFDIETVVT